MQQGLGWLRWSVTDFWNATLEEFSNAVIGFGESRGVKPEGQMPLPEEEYDRLIRMVEDEVEKEAEAAQ
jgi:hypothetical protein